MAELGKYCASSSSHVLPSQRRLLNAVLQDVTDVRKASEMED